MEEKVVKADEKKHSQEGLQLIIELEGDGG